MREPHEYANGHIPGAINLPLSRFSVDGLPTGKRVVLICLSGARSSAALRRALAAKTLGICHYPKGMSGWRGNGGAIAR